MKLVKLALLTSLLTSESS